MVQRLAHLSTCASVCENAAVWNKLKQFVKRHREVLVLAVALALTLGSAWHLVGVTAGVVAGLDPPVAHKTVAEIDSELAILDRDDLDADRQGWVPGGRVTGGE